MLTSTNIRIKIVLLMTKFESSAIVRRALQAEFGQDTPSEDKIGEAQNLNRFFFVFYTSFDASR